MKHDRSQKAGKELSLDDRVLSYLEENGATTVQHLYDVLRTTDTSISKLELTNTAWRLAETDQASLNDVRPANVSFLQYLSFWDMHLWLYGSLLVVLIAIFSIYVIPAGLPWIAVRWVLGIILVAFVPGCVTVEALFPRSRLDPFERVGLSVALSLGLAMFVGFFLNFSSWEITVGSIVFGLTVLTIGVALCALARGYLGQ